MLDVWKKQFIAANFSLSHEDPRVFSLSQWQKKPIPSIYYLVYRILITTFLSVSLILSMVDEQNFDKPTRFRVKWVIYLTNWGFLLCTLQAILCTIMLSTRFHASRKGLATDQDNNSQLYKVYWITNIIATDFSFGISILYWTLIYNAETMPVDYLNVLVHGTNSVVMFIELAIVAHPVKFGHCYITMMFGTAYAIFSVIYYYAGGTARDDKPCIYNILDWSKPISASSVCIGAIIFQAVIHSVIYLLYRLRIKLAAKLIKTEDANSDKADIQVTDLKF